MVVVFHIIPTLAWADSSRDLMSVWNQRVDPATHPAAQTRAVPPITWEDLGNRVIVPYFREVPIEKKLDGSLHINMEAYRDFYEMWRYHGFESPRVVQGSFIHAGNARELIDEWAEHDTIMLSAICCMSWSVDGAFSLPVGHSSKVPEDIHQYALEKMGGRFGGWEYPEEDDRYNLVTAYLIKSQQRVVSGLNPLWCWNFLDLYTFLGYPPATEWFIVDN